MPSSLPSNPPDGACAQAPELLFPELPQQRHKVVLVIDLVESVRLMAANEAGVVNQWRGFVHNATRVVLPACNGRMVKSLGDGLLAEFDRPTDAVRAALAMHEHFALLNASLPASRQLLLRAGINASQLYADENDVYGHGVNLAARVAGLAAPGETIITASVFDGIVVGMDAAVEDRGDNYLKHWPEPVRTWAIFAVTGSAARRAPMPDSAVQDFRPSIAVVPFETRSHAPEQFVVGELIADGVIAQLSRSPDLRVISRLSTTAFRGRPAPPVEIGERLEATFVLGGSYLVHGTRVVIMAELTDNRRTEVIWAERLSGELNDLMEVHSVLLAALSDACAKATLDDVVHRTMVKPVPQLDSNALMLGGITLMHRSTPRDLHRSRQLLEAVTERHTRVATPWAWLAKWHILQVVQGMSSEPARDFQRAISNADRALDLEPESSLALAIKGHAMCHLGDDVAASRDLLDRATGNNPNDPIAWLYCGFWSCMWGDAQTAVTESHTAAQLSPLDPQRFYFDMLLANSYLAAGLLANCIEASQASLQRNRFHPPTLRTLMTAQHESGLQDDARKTLQWLRAIQPQLTLSDYLRYGKTNPQRQRIASAFKALGLPQG